MNVECHFSWLLLGVLSFGIHSCAKKFYNSISFGKEVLDDSLSFRRYILYIRHLMVKKIN